MGQVSRKLRSIGDGQGNHLGYMHWCPGCEQPHAIYDAGGGPRWTFNGDLEKPHFEPSIRVFTTHDGQQKTLCHYFLRGGMLEFCEDSLHHLKKQTVPLPDFPENW